MANLITTQLLVDGPRNAIVKVVGILDTSDVAATGQIGSGGFTTTIGSKTIAFTAGALTPTLGQYVTFSDGTTTFPAGTYITGITDATHITVNNAALATNVSAAITITGTAGAIVIADPAEMGYMDFQNQHKATQLRVDRIIYTVEEGLDVRLFWEATANTYIIDLVKAGHQELWQFGGYQNNAGAGKTGRIVLTTEGWSAVREFTILLHMIKQTSTPIIP